MLKAGRVVALDTTKNLLSRVAGLTVRLVAERVPAAWQSRVTSHDGRIFIARPRALRATSNRCSLRCGRGHCHRRARAPGDRSRAGFSPDHGGGARAAEVLR